MALNKLKYKSRLISLLCVFLTFIIISFVGVNILNVFSSDVGEGGYPGLEDSLIENEIPNNDLKDPNSGAPVKPFIINSVEEAAAQLMNFTKNYAYESQGFGNVVSHASAIGMKLEENLMFYEYLLNDTFGHSLTSEGSYLGKLGFSPSNSSCKYLDNNTDNYYSSWYGSKDLIVKDGNKIYGKKGVDGASNSIQNFSALKDKSVAPFKYQVNKDTMINPVLTKNMFGYKFEFELTEVGASYGYNAFLNPLIRFGLQNLNIETLRYSVTFDNYGRVKEFNKEENFNFEMQYKGMLAKINTSYKVNYLYKNKSDKMVIEIPDFAKKLMNQG